MGIATTWLVRGREATGITADPAANAAVLAWSLTGAVGTLPWAVPEYPTLLVYQIGVQMTTSAVVGARRLSLILDALGRWEWLSSGTQAASLVRRFECGVGVALDTTLTSTIYREPLPRGLMLIASPTVECQLTVAIHNPLAGDVLGPISIRGHLLYP